MKRQYISPTTTTYSLSSECELLTGTNVSVSVPDTNVPGIGPGGFEGEPSTDGGEGHEGLPPATAKGYDDVWVEDEE
jgi:hypothetical protein